MTIATRLCVALLALAVALPAAAGVKPTKESMTELKDDPLVFLNSVQSYLETIEQLSHLSEDPLAAIIVAGHDIKELYALKGEPQGAIQEFRNALKGIEDPAARTALRFQIVDVLRETGDNDKALEELRAIMLENIARLNASDDAPKR